MKESEEKTNKRFRVLDLFAGIGGFSLAAHWMGWETVAFVEWAEYQQKVLAKNFPGVPIYGDIREFDGNAYRGTVDVICGGFPCQDVSTAGEGVGIEGERSGLWTELHRTVCEIRPKYVVVENVAVLLKRGIWKVLGDFSEIGYDAEWRVFSACELGFPHSRERVFIVAYPGGKPRTFGVLNRYCQEVGGRDKVPPKWGSDWFKPEMASGAHSVFQAWEKQFSAPPLVRVDDGISNIVDRLKGTGNAIIPQIAFEIFRAIEAAENDFTKLAHGCCNS
jgi:DNA (cytosine-5)-methyltransferase 1